MDATTHLGTLPECPYHHFEDGKSVGIYIYGTCNLCELIDFLTMHISD